MVFSSPGPPIDRPWNSSDASTRVISDMRSALIADVDGTRIINLNDCPFESEGTLQEFATKYGPTDVLMTQFSYAAWKGGRHNVQWRTTAAEDRLRSVVRHGRTLKAKIVIQKEAEEEAFPTMLNDAG